MKFSNPIYDEFGSSYERVAIAYGFKICIYYTSFFNKFIFYVQKIDAPFYYNSTWDNLSYDYEGDCIEAAEEYIGKLCHQRLKLTARTIGV